MRRVTDELLQAIHHPCSEGHPITLDASAGMDVYEEIVRLRERSAVLEALLREIDDHDDVSFGPLTGDLRDRVRNAMKLTS